MPKRNRDDAVARWPHKRTNNTGDARASRFSEQVNVGDDGEVHEGSMATRVVSHDALPSAFVAGGLGPPLGGSNSLFQSTLGEERGESPSEVRGAFCVRRSGFTASQCFLGSKSSTRSTVDAARRKMHVPTFKRGRIPSSMASFVHHGSTTAKSGTTRSSQFSDAVMNKTCERLKSGTNCPEHGFLSTNNVYLMDKIFAVVGISGVCFYFLLLSVVYLITPPEAFVMLGNPEFGTTLVGSGLIFGSLVSKMAPLLFERGWSTLQSGIIVGALCVQLIAAGNDLAMAAIRIPILLDPVTGARVYPFRYCEWTVLAFIMTFMTEGLDVPQDDPEQDLRLRYDTSVQAWRHKFTHVWKLIRTPFLMGLAMGVSTVCGLIFPYLTSTVAWIIWMVISCVLWLILFPRLYYKRCDLLRMSKGTSVDELELYERVRLCYRLLFTCVCMWSILVSAYFVGSFAAWFAPEGSILGHTAVPFICEAVIDVVAKAMYMDVIVDAHRAIFDDRERAARRLEELRRLMSVVWECSSDIIAISVQGQKGEVTTMLSPNFHKIEDVRQCRTGTGKENEIIEHKIESMPIVFEMKATDCFDGQRDQSTTTKDVNHDNFSYNPCTFMGKKISPKASKDFDAIYFVDLMDGERLYFQGFTLKASDNPALSSVRTLMVKAWKSQMVDSLHFHEVRLSNGCTIQFEAKATKLGSNAIVVVMRDVSERFMCFEAEKRAVSESTARKKDSEANRFTRHEVKNGLLAAIALCDSLRESMTNVEVSNTSGSGSTAFTKFISDLDVTIRDILDTVLAEAMARDVIHEVYEPKMERVDLVSVLSGVHGKGGGKRFQIVTNPSPLPIFLFDPQLMKYIHRNAISNACKYGKKGGVVVTEVHFDVKRNELEMKVINLPGDNHDSLVMLGDHAREAVFKAGKRLHGDVDVSSGSVHRVCHSSGDGAWISRKCARTLGGDCDIRFERDQTVFTLRCQAKTYDGMLKLYPGAVMNPSEFRLPQATWGVAIDDSKIQRKLMQRFFSVAGIAESRQVLLGKDAEEIRGFVDHVKHLIQDNPNSFLLLIVDENLDVVEDDNHYHTVSGSLSIQNLRNELQPQEEERMLALVRSANDSASDVAMYDSRAHGFIRKAPIQRDKTMEILAPLWARRFGERFPHSMIVGNDAECVARPRFDADANVSASVDVMESLEVIDALCIQNSTLLTMRWPALWDRIVSLKHDLNRLEQNRCIRDTLDLIDGLEGSTLPIDFLSRWSAIRSQIIRVI